MRLRVCPAVCVEGRLRFEDNLAKRRERALGNWFLPGTGNELHARMTKKWGRRRNYSVMNLPEGGGMRPERKNSLDETGSDVSSSGSDDGNYPNGAFNMHHQQQLHQQRMGTLNSAAPTFSPAAPKSMNIAAPTYQPNFAQAQAEYNRKNNITIKPTEFSTEDIYEHSRVPSGIVVTTSGGQRIEFWDRVHVPHQTEGTFHSKEQWTSTSYNPYGSVS